MSGAERPLVIALRSVLKIPVSFVLFFQRLMLRSFLGAVVIIPRRAEPGSKDCDTKRHGLVEKRCRKSASLDMITTRYLLLCHSLGFALGRSLTCFHA